MIHDAEDAEKTDEPGTGRHRSGRASIYDVAQAADVSVPTVSRVLTGAARVSPEKRDRVLAAIEELQYRPSSTARALVSGRRDQVAVMTSDTATHGYSMTIKGLENAARAAGKPVVISVVESADEDQLRHAAEVVQQLPLAGVAVLNFDPVGVALLEILKEISGLPVVAVSGEVDGHVPQAVLDEESAAYALVSSLLELGHGTVHHVTVPPSRREDGRTTGWRRALVDAGAPVPDLIAADTFGPASGTPIGMEIAARGDVTAVFCGNDEVAMGVIAGIENAGSAVPGDVSVVGFDDHPLAQFWRPALTTVHQDFVDLGARAFALLQRRIGGDTEPALDSALPWVVERGSAAPPRAARAGNSAP